MHSTAMRNHLFAFLALCKLQSHATTLQNLFLPLALYRYRGYHYNRTGNQTQLSVSTQVTPSLAVDISSACLTSG